MDQTAYTEIRHVILEALEKNSLYREMETKEQDAVKLGVLFALTTLIRTNYVPVPKQHWNRVVSERDSLESVLISLGLPIAVLTETDA